MTTLMSLISGCYIMYNMYFLPTFMTIFMTVSTKPIGCLN